MKNRHCKLHRQVTHNAYM